jgi:hypothetical protein
MQLQSEINMLMHITVAAIFLLFFIIDLISGTWLLLVFLFIAFLLFTGFQECPIPVILSIPNLKSDYKNGFQKPKKSRLN